MGLFRREKINPHRLKEIAQVLAKYGFDYAAEKTKIKRKIPFAQHKNEITKTYNNYQRIRMALEELGPTYVKLGQILSTRPDLVGTELSHELSKLQDSVKPFAYEDVEKEIKKELGKNILDAYHEFEHKPLASASLAQVHKAKTKQGKTVVVKVQRPNIEENIKQDIQIMHYLAELGEKHSPEWKNYRLTEIVEEFERSLTKELNFELEGKNILRFKEMFKEDKHIVIPKYYPELSSKRIITMEYIKGTPLTEVIEGNYKKEINKPLIARLGAEAYFKQVLEHGFFHADLHPGNMLVIEGNKLAFVDFGMVGWLEKENIEDISKLFIALIDCDVRNIINQLIAMNLIGEDTDTDSLREDISDLMESYYGLELKEVNLGQTATQLMVLLTRYRIQIPKEYTMLSRSLLLVEGSAQKLDPEFNAVEIFKPYAIKLAAKQLSPKQIFQRVRSEVIELEGLSRTIPRIIRTILSKIESGKLKLEFEHKNLDIFAKEIDHTTNKIVLAIILAALIMGSSIAMLANNSIHIYGLPTLSLIGFLVSAILGFVLVISSMKKMEIM